VAPTRIAPVVACVTVLAMLAGPAGGVSARDASAVLGSQEPSLQGYLARMSWPVTQSVLHATALRASISGWIHPGDPPFLGQIAQACRKFREVETHRSLVQVDPPQKLRARHEALARAYAHMRRRCNDARVTVLAVAAASAKAAKSGSTADRAAFDKAAAFSRTSLREFRDGTLRRFSKTVNRWRTAVLHYSAALGVPAPSWLTKLAH